MKDSIISKLAAQCSDFYADAMKSIQHESLKDLQKVWLPILAGKQALYHAMSEFHRSEHENTEKNIGEALSRLTVSNFENKEIKEEENEIRSIYAI